MRIILRLCTISVWFCVSQTAFGSLSVSERSGTYYILRDDVVISSVNVRMGDCLATGRKTAFEILQNGTKVWNVWDESQHDGYRFEIAARSDGAIELTFQSQVVPKSESRARWLSLCFPKDVLLGKAFTSVKAVTGRYDVEEGVFCIGKMRFKSRWLAVDGLTFDFNPIGPGDEECCDTEGWSHQDTLRGAWQVEEGESGEWKMFAGACPQTPWGGYVGAKLVIREGEFSDYDSIHALRRFDYGQRLDPARLLAFGASRFGSAFVDGNRPYSRNAAYGWVDGVSSRVLTGHSEGVCYSSVAGEGPARYRFSGLVRGVHLVTFTAGNFIGERNRFAVSANGTELASDLNIPSGKVFSVTFPIHVTNDAIDVSLSGKWLLSSLAVQPLMHDAEDFSMNRGCWVVDGWEPTWFHRNDTIRVRPRFALRRELRDLPIPGTEFATSPHSPVKESELPPLDLPSLDWMRKPSIVRLFNNSSTLAELDDQDAVSEYFDRELSGCGYNAVMISGMHSRHTYVGQEERGLEAIRRIADEAHRRGMKVIDHFDATLTWNVGEGFRVMTERLPELNISRDTGLPSYQFCFYNPEFRRRMYEYLEREVRNGVDGFQLDEIQFWRHGCVCCHCREGFRRETGWWIPENELDPSWNNWRSPFMKRWFEWKVVQATDFFLDFRRRVRNLKPDLILSAYTVPWASEFSVPKVGFGRDVFDLARTFNFFGYEICSRCVMRSVRFELPALRVQNLLAPDYSLPMWDWYYNADWQNDYVAWALSSMTGRSPLLAVVKKDASVPDYVGFGEPAGAMKRLGAKPIAETALLFSVSSRDWNSDDAFFGKEYGGVGQALEALHIPYETIGEDSLVSGRLSRYKSLLVNSAHCLSDGAVAAVRDFAKKGGIVRLSGQAGLFNERGDRRAVWPFRDVFGFEPVVEPRSDRTYEKSLDKGRIVYTPALRGEEFFQVLQMTHRPYDFCPDPMREATFRREIVSCASSWWKIRAPETVYTALWREADEAVAVHFLNLTGVKPKLGVKPAAEAPDPAFPPLDQDIEFVVPEGDVAVAVSPDFNGQRTLPSVRCADGSLAVTLPKELLKAYTLVRIGKEVARQWCAKQSKERDTMQ